MSAENTPDSRTLVVVDVQNDFCEDGALAVEGGNAVAGRIATHLDTHTDHYHRVVFSRDWHQVDGDNGGHFALPPSAPDFEDAWPVHCVQGTAGATYHPAIRAAQERLRATTTDVVHVVKGEGRPDYSIAQGRVADADGGPAPEDAPRSLATLFTGPIDVVGLAYDYCVRASALDIERCPGAGPVRVLTDLTAAVHPEADDRTAADLTAHGIRPETSAKADAADVHHHSRSSVRKEA